MQQLDLFGNYQPEPPAKKKLPEVKQEAAQVPELPVETVEETIDTVIVDPAISASTAEIKDILAEKAAAEIPPVAEGLVLNTAKNTLKPQTRVFVEQPRPEKKKETAIALKPKSKRGRKSYKEIDAEIDLIEVPDEEVLNQKLYYSITEVARWFRVNASLLRYWENEFDILKPRKNRKGDRLFRPEDIKNLQVIYYLLRNRKFSLEGAKKYLRNNRHQADMHVQLAQSLTKFRSFLLDLKANLGA